MPPNSPRKLDPVVPGAETAVPENAGAIDAAGASVVVDTGTAASDELEEARAQIAADRAQIDAERAELDQLREQVNQGAAELRNAQQAHATRPTPNRSVPVNNQDWSERTSAEAQAAGVTKAVLCKDGHYVPEFAFGKAKV